MPSTQRLRHDRSWGLHATWFTPVCLVEEGGQPTERVVFPFAPRKDVILHDNWHVSGCALPAAATLSFRMSSSRTVWFMSFNPSQLSPLLSIGCRPARSTRGRLPRCHWVWREEP